MKIGRILKIVLAFILMLSALSFITSGSFYIIQKYFLMNETVQKFNFWEFSLYIVGYGSSPNIDIGMQLFLGIIGIIMISLLSALLTVDLFRRAKDVLISKNLIVWRNEEGEYLATILVGNLGKPICNVSISAQLFDSMGETIDMGENSREKPIIIKKHIWRVNYKIKVGSFMYEFFRDKYNGRGFMKLYVLVSFVDTDTGQDSIICKEYKLEDVKVVDSGKSFIYPRSSFNADGNVDLNNMKREVWKQFKSVAEDADSKHQFINFICANIIDIDMKNAVPIVENGDLRAVSISHDLSEDTKTQSMAVKVNFNKQEKGSPSPDFIMGLIQFLPFENWAPYYEKDYKLEFEISSSAGLSSVQLEIKDSRKSKILDISLKTSENLTKYSFNLKEHGTLEKWSEVQELCFTVFKRSAADAEGMFKVTGLQLSK